MQRILLLLKKIHLGAIFIIFEALFLYLFFHSDTYMLSKYISVAEMVTLSTDNLKSDATSYLSLKEKNDSLLNLNSKLIAENNALRARVGAVKADSSSLQYDLPVVLSLKVIKNEFLNNNNFIVLNGGSEKGVKEGMAVIGNSGIVGYIKSVSNNFAVAISLLSMDNFVSSAKIKGTNNAGTLIWNGKHTNVVQMIEVPKYADIQVGDTILTTSYSSIFPENIPIGRVANLNLTDGTFYTVNVNTFEDFSNLDYLYLLEIKNKEERDSLEQVTIKRIK